MANCCKTNTCVEITPSACVRYTGTPTTGGLIDKQDYCDPYLNEIINLFDDSLTNLDTRVGLNKMTFDNVNQSCGIKDVINTSGLTIKNDKYYSSEVVLELVKVICELRSRLNYLTKKDINDSQVNLHWEDMPLSEEFLTWMQNNSCFNFSKPDCSQQQEYDKTLGGLLKAIIIKLCTCCS
jgi:hypothetical protein